jgi:hypothetical protein
MTFKQYWKVTATTKGKKKRTMIMGANTVEGMIAGLSTKLFHDGGMPVDTERITITLAKEATE